MGIVVIVTFAWMNVMFIFPYEYVKLIEFDGILIILIRHGWFNLN